MLQSKYNFISFKDNGVSYFGSYSDGPAEFYPYYWMHIKYLDLLYQKGLEPLSFSTINTGTLFIQLTRNLLYILLPVIIILMFYNLRTSYHKQGTDKTMMVIPNFHSKFYFYTLISDVLLVFSIVIIPILIIFIILGVQKGFSSLDYPVLVNVEGITGFTLYDVKGYAYGTKDCIEKNIMHNIGMTWMSTEMTRNSSLDYISISVFILLTTVLLFLMIAFYYQITFTCSYLFKA